MISCLMVTQEGRNELSKWAIHDFARQTFIQKELIVLHDGSADYHQYLVDLSQSAIDSDISIQQVAQGKTLGELRNESVSLANGDIVCQWDDDDRYHSQRLEIQYQQMIKDNADFCFFTDQLHYFTQSNELFWDDWNIETYPMNLIQGTLMGSKEKLPNYPNLAKGEDTPVILELVKQGNKVAQLKDHGYLYLYQFTGKNTWDFQHHGAISALKRYRPERLQKNLVTLQHALKDYGAHSLRLPDRTILLPSEDGSIKLRI